jgi:hypothetical protein
MSEDQRQHPRYAIELDTLIETVDRQIQGRTRDLSKGGFCVLANEAVALGTACKVRLALVFSENQFSEQLTLAATVVWCTPVQGVHQIGIKLAPIDPQNRGYLDMFIKFLEGGEEDAPDEDDADAPDSGGD